MVGPCLAWCGGCVDPVAPDVEDSDLGEAEAKEVAEGYEGEDGVVAFLETDWVVDFSEVAYRYVGVVVVFINRHGGRRRQL